MPINAVIYDMDGLILDNEPAARQAYRNVIRNHGRIPVDPVYTPGTHGNMAIIKQKYDLPQPLDELRREWHEMYTYLLPRYARALPGVYCKLATFALKGLPQGLASTSRRVHVDMVLNLLEIKNFFRATVGGDEVKRQKPKPDIYLEAAARLGVPPTECAAFEDSEAGSIAALTAGMKVVAVPNKSTANQNHRAHLKVTSLCDVTWDMLQAL